MMSKPKYVVFDMDDVVAKMRIPMSEHFNEVSDRYIHHEDWHTLDCIELYDVPFDANDMINKRLIERCEPEDGAKETFDKLHEMGFKIAVATARGWHPKGAELTEEWLHTHGLHQDEIHVVELAGGLGKTSVFNNISEKGRITAFIDDQEKYLKQSFSHDAVEKTYAMNRPWNINATDFDHRVTTLSEFTDQVIAHDRKVQRKLRSSSSLSM